VYLLLPHDKPTLPPKQERVHNYPKSKHVGMWTLTVLQYITHFEHIYLSVLVLLTVAKGGINDINDSVSSLERCRFVVDLHELFTISKQRERTFMKRLIIVR